MDNESGVIMDVVENYAYASIFAWMVSVYWP